MPFPFFFATLVFVVILTYFLKKGKKAQDEAFEVFWERERQSNASRRKDIEGLPYLEVPDSLFSARIDSDSEKRLVELSQTRMLNLTEKSNTDLKIEYGPQNLETLSACDDRFVEFSITLPVYAQELLDHGHKDLAIAILEFGVQNQCDCSKIYTMLADLYSPDRIPELIDAAGKLPAFSQTSIIQKLQAYLP